MTTKRLALLLFLVAPASLAAQDPPKKIPIAEIKAVRVGYYSNDPADSFGRYKIGMWTPVYVKIKAGPQGIRPKGPNEPHPYIQVESDDNEDVGTIYRTPFIIEPNEEPWILTYAKPGKFSDIKLRVIIGDLEFRPLMQTHQHLELNTHLYVSLGDRIPDLQTAVHLLSPMKQQNVGQGNLKDSWPRYAGFEPEFTQLPDNWFGYQGVDVLFLSTRDKDFLLNLGKDNDVSRAKLKAIAQYVRRGGRLVIGVSPRNTDVLAQVLQSTVWQPALPVVPPKEGSLDVKRLPSVAAFANNFPQVFLPQRVSLLEPAKLLPGAWEVMAATEEPNQQSPKPVIARMSYGLGSITYIAFGLDEPPFTGWDGKVQFLQELVKKIGPRVSGQVDRHEQRAGFDLSTDLQKSLDNFDVRVIPFGYVALFIVLYILVVGPLDFVLLKYVFKRLEWTWFTFPTVVLAVSIAAYYTAYAIKGSELKINRVDLIDIDQRTNLDSKGQTIKAFASGHSFFAILSPRIQNYTVGIEPNPLFWGQNAAKPASADMVTWLGRADQNVFGGMGGRGGGQSFFRKPYRYDADAAGLIDVPIPVWTTKSFHASWEMPGIAPPLESKLTYYQTAEKGKDVTIAGTLKNGLAVDLEDVWLMYNDKAWQLTDIVPKGAEVKIHFERGQEKTVKEWPSNTKDGDRVQTAQGAYNPGPIVRQIQFQESVDITNTTRNHALRPIDLSWRLNEGLGPQRRDNRIREAILVARVKFTIGSADAMNRDVNQPMPTKLWLGALPNDGGALPDLAGTLVQDTFVRVLLPVRPKE